MSASDEMIADVIEALEDTEFLQTVYVAILRKTQDKKQAADAVLYIRKLMKGDGLCQDSSRRDL